MLTGKKCGSGRPQLTRVSLAKNLTVNAQFVGLTENWNEKNELFASRYHKPELLAQPVVFENTRPSHASGDSVRKAREFLESHPTFRDADEEVYYIARKRFGMEWNCLKQGTELRLHEYSE
jgi:ABC-type ATPase with predicted acetyltransferase domain